MAAFVGIVVAFVYVIAFANIADEYPSLSVVVISILFSVAAGVMAAALVAA